MTEHFSKALQQFRARKVCIRVAHQVELDNVINLFKVTAPDIKFGITKWRRLAWLGIDKHSGIVEEFQNANKFTKHFYYVGEFLGWDGELEEEHEYGDALVRVHPNGNVFIEPNGRDVECIELTIANLKEIVKKYEDAHHKAEKA